MRRLFGPVRSRRLGRSLGVDIVPYKTCSFDCVYCECGPTTLKTAERKVWVPASEVLEELEAYLRSGGEGLDVITFSGSGEPTLNAELGVMVRGIKRMTSVPVAVLTNSSLMHLPEVREDLTEADIVVPSLDAATPEVFRRIDRPLEGMTPERIIEALAEFRRPFRGRLWLEILFVEGLNTGEDEVAALKAAVERIRPDKVQLNTVDRAPVYGWVKPVSKEGLEAIARRIGWPRTEVVSSTEPLQTRQGVRHAASAEIERRVMEALGSGPKGAGEVAEMLGIPGHAVERTLRGLAERGLVRRLSGGGYESCLR